MSANGFDNPAANVDWVGSVIKDHIAGSSDNRLTMPRTPEEPAWQTALIGVSSGDDHLYRDYKRHVGPFHYTPAELFNATFPDRTRSDDHLSVISWILPQTEATRSDNAAERVYPAERWARARIFGEKYNVALRSHVVAELASAGFAALAPQLSPLWERKESEQFTYASNWSERHAAHAAGLGTFGLCDGLITPLGKAVRVGSVITDMPLAATPRPYDHHRAWCTFFSHGQCGECIDRCPVNALSKDGHDKIKCRRHVKDTAAEYIKKKFDFDGYGCGLCQTGVPCEAGIPQPE